VHIVQMRKKPTMTMIIPAPRRRLRPPRLRGGKHRDQRRRPRSTERVLLRRESAENAPANS
jgi:hypothetical protein